MCLPIQSSPTRTRLSCESWGVKMKMVDPAYLADLTEDKQAPARCRFLIRLAALYYSPEGKVSSLSEKLGLHPGTLAGSSTITPEIAIRLEELLGREHFPRSLFRPDLFLIQD